MEIKNSYWMTDGPWYITSICNKLHVELFEVFIINARTDRYNIVCYTDAYERDNQSYSCDYGISSEGFKLSLVV